MDAKRIFVRGVVQGVGFRPFAYHLAQSVGVRGWVLNAGAGVEIHIEGPLAALDDFVRRVALEAPAAAGITRVESSPAEVQGAAAFRIRESERGRRLTTHISPDLPVCDDCLRELFNPHDRRWGYPYLNCTRCGPRFSLIVGLPYDRSRTTMAAWPLCEDCRREFDDPADRRFHAQPTACPRCGPHYVLQRSKAEVISAEHDAVKAASELLSNGEILAIKSLGGYHLACDARNRDTVARLRARKYRKEKPFAVMARDLTTARQIVDLTADATALLLSPARPIVLAPVRVMFPEVAPGYHELGVMLPYSPLHHLLFDVGAPDVLVMTSANRSSEPIAYLDDDAFQTLGGIADAFLVGERVIARRIDDSVVRGTPFGAMTLRRARGYAPRAAAQLPTSAPILAVGGDLKNAITLMVDGEAFVSQHIGDLQHYAAKVAFQQTVRDFLQMYDVKTSELIVVHDHHPQYTTTGFAFGLEARGRRAVQHHHAHIASVLAERGELARPVVGVAYDGTGYGEDGTIWGGELFVGSVAGGFSREAHLRSMLLPGGDAASLFPPQAVAGHVAELHTVLDLTQHPFFLPPRYVRARELVHRQVRAFPTTSVGRLFDTIAALLGFTREVTYEGQAAAWLENLAKEGTNDLQFSFPFEVAELDFRPVLEDVIAARVCGAEIADIALSFHAALARVTARACNTIAAVHRVDTVVLSGGVFQNLLLLQLLEREMDAGLNVWTNRYVPANDGGVSLGQAALGGMML